MLRVSIVLGPPSAVVLTTAFHHAKRFRASPEKGAVERFDAPTM